MALTLTMFWQFMPSESFDDKELKWLLKGHLSSMVVDTGLRAEEKVGRKGKKVVDPVVRAAFCERIGAVHFQFLD